MSTHSLPSCDPGAVFSLNILARQTEPTRTVLCSKSLVQHIDSSILENLNSIFSAKDRNLAKYDWFEV